MRFFKHHRKSINLNGPFSEVKDLHTYVIRAQIFNKKNKQWGLMADKYAVRAEVEKAIGAEHLIPLYGHWERPEDIDFDKLPNEYVLKTNNGCGTNFIIHKDNKPDRAKIVGDLKKALTFPYAELSGQLHYSQIPPCVLAEKLMVQGGGHTSLTDYKVHCVNGKAIAVFVFSDRDEESHYDFNVVPYTPRWQAIPHYTSPADILTDAPVSPDKPEGFDLMLDLAAKLSEGEEYVRVDFYIIDGYVYFGEMTYTPDVGYHKSFVPYLKVFDYVLDQIRQGRKDGVSTNTF